MEVPPDIGTSTSASRRSCHDQPDAALHDLPAVFTPGTRVLARDQAWLVTRHASFGHCAAVGLAARGTSLTLLAPFDRITPVGRAEPWHRCRLHRSAAAVLEVIVAGSPFATLQGGAAPLAFPRWQLTPLRLLAEGIASRVLLADAAGLGKTIQAGFVIVALEPRGVTPHVLVITPAGLRDQWAAELSARLGLEPWVADPTAWRRERTALPPNASPWNAHPLVIASVDYVKQPDILASAMQVPWDLVIVDEAHNVGPGSDRQAAVHALAAEARSVLLVTATPHAGNDEQWTALCGIGARSERDMPPVLVRRHRVDVGLQAVRRVRFVRVRPSQAEYAMHEWLHAYARLTWAAQDSRARLAMCVLLKRAASSPWALWRSVAHRRQALGDGEPSAEPAQPLLPFDAPGETDAADEVLPDVLTVPGLADRAREIRLLDELADRARAAAGSWRKAAWLVRRLARIAEPVIVFTEYRDTLAAIARTLPPALQVVQLHGQLARSARADALEAFLDGRARVLLATDVGGEGLNLQTGARTVLSIELPWTPARLAQRIGRVDRIGQVRPVRAVCLVGDDPGERLVSAHLAARLRRVQRALGSDGQEIEADLRVAAESLGIGCSDEGPSRPAAPRAHVVGCPDLDARPDLELAALAWALRRQVTRQTSTSIWGEGAARLPWTRLRRRPGVHELPAGVVFVFRVQSHTTAGTVTGDTTVAVHVAVDPRMHRARRIGRLLRALAPLASSHAARAAAGALEAAWARASRRIEQERARETIPVAANDVTPVVQAGLFDRRALTEAALHRASRSGRDSRRALALTCLDRDLEGHAISEAQPIAAFVCW